MSIELLSRRVLTAAQRAERLVNGVGHLDDLICDLGRAEDAGDNELVVQLREELAVAVLKEIHNHLRAAVDLLVEDLELSPKDAFERAAGILIELRRERLGDPRRAPISKEKRVAVYRRDGYQCVECGEAEIHLLTVDHVVPVRLGGTNNVENLRTLCRSCNSVKGGRMR